MVEQQIQEKQCRFFPGCRKLGQLFPHIRIFEGTRDSVQPVNVCFMDVQKAFDYDPLDTVSCWGCSMSMKLSKNAASGLSVTSCLMQKSGSHCKQ